MQLFNLLPYSWCKPPHMTHGWVGKREGRGVATDFLLWFQPFRNWTSCNPIYSNTTERRKRGVTGLTEAWSVSHCLIVSIIHATTLWAECTFMTLAWFSEKAKGLQTTSDVWESGYHDPSNLQLHHQCLRILYRLVYLWFFLHGVNRTFGNRAQWITKNFDFQFDCRTESIFVTLIALNRAYLIPDRTS